MEIEGEQSREASRMNGEESMSQNAHRILTTHVGKSIAPAGGWAIIGPITYTRQAQIGRNIANLKAALNGSGVTVGFLSVVAPASVLPSRTGEYYKTEEEALFAIAEALHEEYAAVVESGLMVQIDDAFLRATMMSAVIRAAATPSPRRRTSALISVLPCRATNPRQSRASGSQTAASP
jgi:hypothetical protein